MPALKVPDTLVTTSIKSFSCQFLMDSYSGNKPRTDYFVRGLSSLPVGIFNAVVANIIKKISMCDPPYSKKVSLTSVLTSFMSEKLTHLDLSCFQTSAEYLFPHFREEFLHILPSLKNLVQLCLFRKSLVQKYLLGSAEPSSYDDILRSIGKYCNLLKDLNMNYNRVTDQALLCLIPSNDYRGCPELENLDILNCRVAASAVAQLLERLPNIRIINYENIAEALLLLHRSLKCNNEHSVLVLKYLSLHSPESYSLGENCKICETEGTPLALCLHNLCPEIESVSVHCNDMDVPMLKFFTKLTSIEIYFRNDDSAELKTMYYLTNYGTQLTSLKINLTIFYSNWFLTIGKSCPTLRELSVQCECLRNILNFEPGEEKTLKIFSFLSSFSLEALCSGDHGMEPLSVLQLLKSTRSLTHLLLRCHESLCDDEGFKEYWDIINTQSLLSVTISRPLSSTDLTISTARLILDSCPVLKKLGELATWNIDRKEVEDLKTSLKKSNYDVEIIYSLKDVY